MRLLIRADSISVDADFLDIEDHLTGIAYHQFKKNTSVFYFDKYLNVNTSQ